MKKVKKKKKKHKYIFLNIELVFTNMCSTELIRHDREMSDVVASDTNAVWRLIVVTWQ